MHLVVPYAAPPAAAGVTAWQGLQLPHLQQLLAEFRPGPSTGTAPGALNLPHELVLAACRGAVPEDGRVPHAAWAAAADGLPAAPPDQGWGLLTPTHWQVGTDQIVLLDPEQLHLDEDESRALWHSLRPMFESEGWALHWGAPLRWYATHVTLATLATASLDRVVGRGIEAWMPDRQAGRTLRRLQSEAQMLLYAHPVNAAREARGELAVNSFWLSGTGRTPPPPAADGDAPLVDDRLQAAWRAGDVAAWREAWRKLDLERLQDPVRRGALRSLTLCGEHRALRFDAAPGGAWQRWLRRWRVADPMPLLETL
jgi:hypothetical protein